METADDHTLKSGNLNMQLFASIGVGTLLRQEYKNAAGLWQYREK